MADGIKQADILKRYPVTTGIEAGSKHVGRVSNLVPEGFLGVRSVVQKKDKLGLKSW